VRVWQLLDAVGGFRYPSQAETFWKLRLSCTYDAGTLLQALQELAPETRTMAIEGERDPATALFDSQSARLVAYVREIAEDNGNAVASKGAAAALVLRCAEAFPPSSPPQARPAWADGWVELVQGCFGESATSLQVLHADTRASLRQALAKLRPTQGLLDCWTLRVNLCGEASEKVVQLQALHSMLYSSSGAVERIVVSGAGVDVANGEYVREGEYEGAPKFVKGQWWILRYTMPSGARRWYVADCRQLTVDDGDLYYVPCADDLPPCHMAWRKAKDGREPMPLFRHVRGLSASAQVGSPATHAALAELLEATKAQLADEGVDVTALERPPPSRPGLVSTIEARRGWYVDNVTLRLRSGEVRASGGEGGGAMEPLVLDEGERIVHVVQESCRQYLGARISFTLEGPFGGRREFVVEGSKYPEEEWLERFQSHELRAGEEITALRFEGPHLRFVGVSVLGDGSHPEGAVPEWREARGEMSAAEETDEEEGEEVSGLEDEDEDELGGESDEESDDTIGSDLQAAGQMAATVADEEMQLQLALALSISEQ
jgi:hypothetical protein